MILSPSEQLLSEVIENKNAPKALHTFFKDKEKSKGISTSKSLLYLNYKEIYQHSSNLFKSSPDVLRNIRSLSNFTLANISFEENTIEMSGFSYGFEERKYFLSNFTDQQTGYLNLKNVVSNQADMFLDFHIGDALKLKKSLQKYWWDNDIPVFNRWENLDQNLSFELETFYSLIGNEYGLASLKNGIDKILLINSRDGSLALRQLHQINGGTSNPNYESYHDRKLYRCSVEDLPNLLFGNYFKNFKKAYYTSYKDCIIFGNSIQSLKLFINDLDEENVWGKSIDKTKALEKHLVQANMSFISKIDYPKKIWKNKLNQSYTSIFGTNSLSSYIENLIMQWSFEEGRVFTNIVLTGKQGIMTNDDNESFERDQRPIETPEETNTEPVEDPIPSVNANQSTKTELYTTISQQAYFVKNHAYGSPCVLIQDEAFQLFMLTAEGKVLWERELTDQITSDIHIIDYLKNNKTQYLFATQGNIHCLDRLGNELKNFPLQLNNVQTVIPIDYDGSKDYRFLATNEAGDIYLFSKEGKKLSSWFPKKVGGSLICSPRHIRIGSIDYFLAIQKNGIIHLYRRNGTEARGFPVRLNTALQKTYNYEKGGSTSNSYIRVVSLKNVYYKITFDGTISKQQLSPNNDRSRSVEMISNSDNTDYVYLYKKGTDISIKDRFLKSLHNSNFSIDQSSPKELFVFGSTKYVSLFNEKEKKDIVINLSSKSERWIPSSTAVCLHKAGRILKVTTSDDNKIILRTYK